MIALDYPTCATCARELVNPACDDRQQEMSLDCGVDCSGCVAVAEEKAQYAYCAYHDGLCVVWNHYAGSTDLCSPDQCIEHQDITTLMINASYARWKQGEGNGFFDRISSVAAGLDNGTIKTVRLTGMTDEALSQQWEKVFSQEGSTETPTSI